MLLSYSHGTFPIVDVSSGGTLYGTISRSVLSPLLSWEQIEQSYPNYPTIENIILNNNDHECILDLRPYANTTPYTINATASIQRTYRLFRTLGLRFLCVVNHHNQVVGIITREDLLSDSLDMSMSSSSQK